MSVSIRSIIRDILPPILLRAARPAHARAAGITFSGNYACWNDALAYSTGYDADVILARVEAATSKVASGEAAFERDSAIFNKIEYSFPVLAGLLRAAIENDGHLSVLDFGGSLGSSFRQCQSYLSVLRTLEWRVVEQEHFVRLGRDRFESNRLRFFFSIQEAVATGSPTAVLISGVLQYLEHPHEILNELYRTGSRYVIIDRTPFADISADRLVVQRVPESIYPASYPCWLFSRERFVASVDSEWQILADFPSIDGTADTGGVSFRFCGMIMRRRD